MPYTKDKMPSEGTSVVFRTTGDKHLHKGTFKDGSFEVCSVFFCYTLEEVDYWRAINEI